MSEPRLVIVTPVFEEPEAVSLLLEALRAEVGADAYVVAVDDGSVRHPLAAETIAQAGLPGCVLRLRRNVGHQRAIATGLGYVASRLESASRIVVMDSDGEDRPDTVRVLLDALEDTSVDIVVARRRGRHETLGFRLFYWLYLALFHLLTGRRLGFGNFMAMKRPALLRLAAMGELGTHVASTVLVSRLRWRACRLDRGRRLAGSSKMNFVSLALHGFKGLMVFAEDVLVRVGSACALVALLSLLASAVAIVLKSIGYATPGWFSVALGILVLMFLQTGAITLMTLMLTGVVRGASVLPIDHAQLVCRIEESDPMSSRT